MLCHFSCVKVLARGVGLSTHSDSELITQALCLNPPEGETNGPDWTARIKHLMKLAPLSYSLVIMLKNKIYAVRDPYGNRPLCLGKILPQNERKSNINDCLELKNTEKKNMNFNVKLLKLNTAFQTGNTFDSG